VAFADGAWPSNRWAVLGAEVSAQGTEFIITRSACVFAASIVRREKRELNYVFFFFTFATNLSGHLLPCILYIKHGVFLFLFIENMGSYFFCFLFIEIWLFYVFL
jgi:hypothetical protein